MSDAKQFIVSGIPVSVKDEQARNSIGNLADLNTTAKSNLVAAINEAAQSGSGEGSDPEAVKFVSQSLTASQKTQARTNIGAASSGDIPSVPVISTDISADASSNLKTASPKAVKDYVDAHSGSGDDPEAVKYTAQSLEDSQKAQARANIGAASADIETTIQDAVDDYLEEHPAIIGTFPNSAKRFLISLLEKVAYIDGNGQQYINQLRATLNDVPIDHIEAVFTQGSKKIYDLDGLDVLRDYLVVTAYFVDDTHAEIFDYELSGSLVYGTSTITVTADEETDTFNVTVTGTKKLYYDGDECSAVTGGWNNLGYNLTNGTPSKTKEASDLLIKFGTSAQTGGAAGSWSTINKIDLTGYTMIVVEVEAYNASGRGTLWAYWPSTISDATTQSSAYGSDYSSNRVTIRDMGRASNTSTYPFPSPAETTETRMSLHTERTEAYLSLNLNLYTDTDASPSSYYSAGAYVKIKKVFLATN